MRRVFWDILLLLCIFILPWWVTLLLAFTGLFCFISYYEFIGVLIIIHILYSVPNDGFLSSPIWFSLFTIFVFTAVQILKRYIIFYKQ